VFGQGPVQIAKDNLGMTTAMPAFRDRDLTGIGFGARVHFFHPGATVFAFDND
jgi:hypothetical protein